MQCLQGYIKLRVNDDDVSPSELFINDLEGISLKMLDSIASIERPDFMAMWQKIEKKAIDKIEVLLQARILANYSITDDEVVSCIVCANKKKLRIAWWYYLGVETMLEWLPSERTNFFTTVDIGTAEANRDAWFIEFKDQFKAATACMDVKACLPVRAHVQHNGTYKQKTVRF